MESWGLKKKKKEKVKPPHNKEDPILKAEKDEMVRINEQIKRRKVNQVSIISGLEMFDQTPTKEPS